ncbi:MAG: thiamine pyrophosphate-dependent enzyme, partial [Acidobacteriota bacterium]
LEASPAVTVGHRLQHAERVIADACDGVLVRAAMQASLTDAERLEMLQGMVMTRAIDNRLKLFFMNGDVRHEGRPFQGKGFRSLGQEAIYAAPLRLRRGPRYRDPRGSWKGDIVAPLIRDLGAALAMRRDDDALYSLLNAQMGKAGPPMNGKDLHLGDFSWGILPPSAPLAISSLSAAGLGMAMARQGSSRVVATFIGEGGASLGEWHEAINLCAAHRLPVIFCIENNQTALSTPVHQQSAVRAFADRAMAYGMPGLTLDGTDPEAVAVAFAWAAERARAGLGPTLLEVVSMRMCGHAHHDDMLYLGREPQPGWTYPKPAEGGYVDHDAWAFWAPRDPIPTYAARLTARGLLREDALPVLQQQATEVVERAAQRVIEAPWPDPQLVGRDVFRDNPPIARIDMFDPGRRAADPPPLPALEPITPSDPKGYTYLQAVMLGVADALEQDPRVFVYGEDVGGRYGNAFLLLRPLLRQHSARIVNAPLAEGGVLGVCIGAALGGLRPIGEMQFNDFVATGFNQLVNNAAKIRYRWGGAVPMVLRMPWGGLRRAGPYHSQNTEPWFYRTAGLKIVVPSTPEDARALMLGALRDPDPVLYYEHIALYRDPTRKQALAEEAPEPMPLGRAALRRAGDDLLLVSYGAYVHRAMDAAEVLAREDGVEAAVLDLRSLVPLDREALLTLARHCGRVMIVQEDSRTGSIGESLAAIVQEEIFEYLDAPVRVLGALDTPVPYAPSLEDVYLLQPDEILRAARQLLAY